MAYLLVPLDVSSDKATVWVGVLDEPLDRTIAIVLEYNLNHQPLDPGRWEEWTSQDRCCALYYQKMTLEGLAARKMVALRLRVGGEVKAEGETTTLPASLPTIDEKPFTVLLGSCFSELQDQGGSVGGAYFHLPPAARPDLKILCGDQVYLDAPWYRYLMRGYSREELETRFFETYRRAWTQAGTASGFQQLLKAGANYFTSDDHEYWNNAPNKGIYARHTWSDRGRNEWFQLARGLFKHFQPAEPTTTFSVGPLSFFIADTRIDRRPDLTEFMAPTAFGDFTRWIQSLKGPGVLVIGQPLFCSKAGVMGRVTDWGLPDYRQYAPIARLIAASKHSIVIVTGDVHYGRVARCALASGVQLVEIISSPMSLVDKSAGGKWSPAPAFFPADAIPGIAKVPIQTEPGFKLTDNHFVTVEFTAVGARVRMTVKGWPIARGGTPPASITALQPIFL